MKFFHVYPHLEWGVVYGYTYWSMWYCSIVYMYFSMSGMTLTFSWGVASDKYSILCASFIPGCGVFYCIIPTLWGGSFCCVIPTLYDGMDGACRTTFWKLSTNLFNATICSLSKSLIDCILSLFWSACVMSTAAHNTFHMDIFSLWYKTCSTMIISHRTW